MFVHRSNRTERLVDALAREVLRPGRGVGHDGWAPAAPAWNEPIPIAVQGLGIEPWLSQALAQRLGVWSLFSFLFPRNLLEQCLNQVLGKDARAELFEPQTLRLLIADRLPELIDRPAFAPLSRYLEQQSKRSEAITSISRTIAETFDRYLVYRPDTLLAWEQGLTTTVDQADPALSLAAGAHAEWQSELWRSVCERLGSSHLAARAAKFTKVELRPGMLPERIFLFGVSSLPPLYLDFFRRISSICAVHLFVSAPSPEWFGDLGRRHAREEGEAAHPLLSSLGNLSRDFLELLAEHEDTVGSYDDFVEPAENTLLGAVQQDLYQLRVRSGAHTRPNQVNLRVHSCHGPFREAEVVRDELLASFSELPGLKPEDVCILTPDLQRYGPFIEACFRNDRRLEGMLSASVDAESTLVLSTFFSMVEIALGKGEVREVVDFIASELVASQWHFTTQDLAELRDTLAQAEVRWGWDQQHRSTYAAPQAQQNTWETSLDRVVLGFAANRRELFGSISAVPLQSAEGVDRWSRLARLVRLLRQLSRDAANPRTPQQWAALLLRSCHELFSCDLGAHPRTRRAFKKLTRILQAYARDAASVGVESNVSLRVAALELEGRLATAFRHTVQFGSGIVFGELVPMRAIPFRVIALVGLNQDLFPRREAEPSFDSMGKAYRRGDRNPRQDDRQLFLELLLASRDRLIISYTGQSAINHERVPPSPILDDLLRTVEAMHSQDSRIREQVVHHHPLHSFSSRYFESDAWFTFSEHASQAAHQRSSREAETRPFSDLPLPTQLEEPETLLSLKYPAQRLSQVSVEELVRFFLNPARSYGQRIGVDFREQGARLESHDRTKPTPLALWKAHRELLQEGLDGVATQTVLRRLAGTGALPPGPAGWFWQEQIKRVGSQLLTASGPLFAAPFREPIEVDLRIEDFQVLGRLAGLGPEGFLEARPGFIEGKGELEIWIRHLVLAAASPTERNRSTVFGRSRSQPKGHSPVAMTFEPVDAPQQLLLELLRIFRAGLQRPLPFFPSASRQYAVLRHKWSAEESLRRVEAQHAESFNRSALGEQHDPSAARIFWPPNPFRCTGWSKDAPGWLPFCECAEAIYGPLLSHASIDTPPPESDQSTEAP